MPLFSVAGGTADSPKDLATGSSLTIKGSTTRSTLHYSIGNGSGKGSITSRQLDFEGGTVNVFMDVKGWTKIEGNLDVSVTGSRTQVVKYTATMADEWEPISLTFEEVSARPVISISTTAKRAFIDRIAVEASSSSGISTPAVADRNHYYTTHGQRLDGKPTLPGIYIVNGKKLLVK